MKTDVMNVKDWLIYFGKFFIPFYNIYWFILCVTGSDKVNVNERNYTLACTLFCAVWLAVCCVITGLLAIFIGLSVPALLSNSKTETEVSSNYDYENNSSESTFEDTEVYNDYSVSEETSVEPSSDTSVEDTPVEDTPVENTPVENTPVGNTPVTGEAVIEAEQFGVHFNSNIPLVLDDFDETYYSYTMDMAYSGYLSVTLYNFEGFTMEEAQDSGKEYTTLSNGVVVNYDEELETITGYVDKGDSIVQIRIYYNEETKEAANNILNSITF